MSLIGEFFFTVEGINMIFYDVLSEAILYQGKSLDLNNTLINSQYLENLVSQVLVLQSIESQICSLYSFSLWLVVSPHVPWEAKLRHTRVLAACCS